MKTLGPYSIKEIKEVTGNNSKRTSEKVLEEWIPEEIYSRIPFDKS